MRNRSLLGTALALSVVAILGAGCKDTEARDQLKKVKAELEEREDELDSAEKRMKEAEKDAASAKVEVGTLKESLEKATKKQAELLARFRDCPESPSITPGPPGGECAAYFKFMEDCIPLMPAAVQSSLKDSVETMKKAMAMGGGLAAGPMEKACKPALDAMMKIPQCSAVPRPATPTAPPCNCDPKDPLCSC